MKTIALDFDGVLHAYTSGWKGPEVIPDPPVEGMAELCRALVGMGFRLVVMSSRAKYPSAPEAISAWLHYHGFPQMAITSEKVPAELYVDDRGFRFNGDVNELAAFVESGMAPWNKGKQIS